MGLIPLWVKGLIAVALVAVVAYGVHWYNDSLRDEGRAEVQAKWDKQNKVDAEARTKDIIAAREDERKNVLAQIGIDEKLLKDTQDEKKALTTQLATARADNRKLRIVSGQTKSKLEAGASGTGTSPGISYETCSIRLPAEIGNVFKDHEEFTLRVGSEANDVADQLRACQAIVLQDRLTCNGNDQVK